MCLAVPARILTVDAAHEMATVTLGDVRKEVSLALVDEARVGDYVLVHVGYALNTLSEEEAAHTLALMAEAGLLAEEAEPPAP